MFSELTTVFVWNESHIEHSMVGASASCDSVEVYYAVENRCARNGSCTVSSHTWFGQDRRYLVKEVLALD